VWPPTPALPAQAEKDGVADVLPTYLGRRCSSDELRRQSFGGDAVSSLLLPDLEGKPRAVALEAGTAEILPAGLRRGSVIAVAKDAWGGSGVGALLVKAMPVDPRASSERFKVASKESRKLGSSAARAAFSGSGASALLCVAPDSAALLEATAAMQSARVVEGAAGGSASLSGPRDRWDPALQELAKTSPSLAAAVARQHLAGRATANAVRRGSKWCDASNVGGAGSEPPPPRHDGWIAPDEAAGASSGLLGRNRVAGGTLASHFFGERVLPTGGSPQRDHRPFRRPVTAPADSSAAGFGFAEAQERASKHVRITPGFMGARRRLDTNLSATFSGTAAKEASNLAALDDKSGVAEDMHCDVIPSHLGRRRGSTLQMRATFDGTAAQEASALTRTGQELDGARRGSDDVLNHMGRRRGSSIAMRATFDGTGGVSGVAFGGLLGEDADAEVIPRHVGRRRGSSVQHNAAFGGTGIQEARGLGIAGFGGDGSGRRDSDILPSGAGRRNSHVAQRNATFNGSEAFDAIFPTGKTQVAIDAALRKMQDQAAEMARRAPLKQSPLAPEKPARVEPARPSSQTWDSSSMSALLFNR
jgi:hypothetical protein